MGASWKTMLFGILAAAAGGVAASFPDGAVHTYAGYAAALFTALLGVFAKDHNVTGGSIPNDK